MRGRRRFIICLGQILAVILVLGLAALPRDSRMQTSPAGQKTDQGGHTIRVNVGLVQTDVMVFDRRGRFVDNLKQDQFELKVDGKAQPISFCELVSAGSAYDERIWAAAKNRDVPDQSKPAPAAANPGRTLLLFLDDWHLSEDSVMRSRSALAGLIETSMGPRDRVGVFAASGQLASLQHLTNDKGALLAALERFNYQSAGAHDLAWPPMTEAQALAIEQNDLDVITYFVQGITGLPVVRDVKGWTLPFGRNPDFGRDVAEAERTTRRRAADLAQLSAGIGERSLSALRNLLHAAEALPGRKLVFLLSDGFVLQPQRSDIVSRLWEMTTAAARAGILIYTLDARGLVVGLPDAKTKRPADMTGALAHSGVNEVLAPQDALNALAADTGGRFLKNTNALDTALINTLNEISRYYLLGWPIDPDSVPPNKYQTIRVSVIGRSDLTVRVRQGRLDLSQLVFRRQNQQESAGKPHSPTAAPATEMELYAKARSVADLARDELIQAYPGELSGLEWKEDYEGIGSLLERVGEKVAAFLRAFPKTVSREQVRQEILDTNGRVQNTVTRNFNYSFNSVNSRTLWEEVRADGNGRPFDNNAVPGFSFLTSGYAGACMFFHPAHSFGSRFRYLGKETAHPGAHVIAFAQIPERRDFMGTFQTAVMASPAMLLYQGLAWVDPGTFQIIRMRTDLLAPRSDVGLARQTSEIWFEEVQFKSVDAAFWLPREVLVTSTSYGRTVRNRHRYFDYLVFTVESQDKVLPPIKK